ncbi:hypothetical protein PTSG_09967 [Salpingoeca rosetta]|uniref:Uncharacterized protein n=1 Tax=Salpingoeca rosetta (strain ATCC 50818 / BSB-021) TaxID=946362 RepID=F2UNP0_SALR5|nr:uncharacterized protein PTSG_09967 [Salpingoeca rosetta]EGD79245.1 hypothetical protein PTSG_09967 [Salpingoeca rosetta]|eukprot:XP_004989330.1 hypothetical protein PTSG_09967 [Salpingoeca rosetta]
MRGALQVAVRQLHRAAVRPIAASPTAHFFAYSQSGTSSDSVVASLVEQSRTHEMRRQRDELVLIPSESICYPECEDLMASCFGNIYAEGQPDLRLSRVSPALATDDALFHAWHRRLSDGRFYRGCGEADRVELLAKYYIAKAFSMLAGSPSADQIHANVQALSGSPANLAIYSALLNYGDNMLTLNLSHGGHLSHGSPFNVSGKLYHVTQYSVDPKTRLLNYDEIRTLAHETKPAIIVGGASAYPWDWDWRTLRTIADEVGALLHADVCHLAGLIVGGQLKNPLPYADTVMFTTHKTLMGPRGSVIVTKDKDIAKKIDNSVFPGMQGGPHVNNIAGIARMFEMICNNRDAYCQLQRRVLDNTSIFAEALRAEGFELEYQGTETHMVMLDMKKFRNRSGNALDGETASRLLENVGIVVNKNTLPGDATAADSSGLRVAAPWITQRGVTADQIKDLARIMRELLSSAVGFQVWAPSGDEKCRARVPYAQLQKSRQEVLALARSLPYPKLDESKFADSLFDPLRDAFTVKGLTAISVRGEKARLALDQALTCNVSSLGENDVACGFLLDADGELISPAIVSNLGWSHNAACGDNGEERMAVFAPQEKADDVRMWLDALSDGYVELVRDDPYLKVDGPFAVTGLQEKDIPMAVVSAVTGLTLPGSLDANNMDVNKAFFVGQHAHVQRNKAEALPTFTYTPGDGDLKQTVLHDWHERNGGEMVGFGGWRMPVKYGSIADEHRAVRTSAALFDVSHMSAVGVKGPQALAFLETTLANTAARLIDNEGQYSYMIREDGTALDDLYVYRLARDNFMLVFNAANFERDFAWLNAVNEGRVCVDLENPTKRVPGPVEIKELRDAGSDSLLDIAFQGPKSMEVLQRLVDTPEQREDLATGVLNTIHHITMKGVPVIAARTGYTGESVGYELFVHPDETQNVWDMILNEGKRDGVVAAGLGARDSARIEAGFPLFGHELEGPEQLSLTEADYGYVSRLHRPFYIGRKPYIERTHPRRKKLVRLKGSGRKTAREGHVVLNEQGEPVGTVTSFAFCDDDFNFYAIAAVDAQWTPETGATIRIARMTKDKFKGPVNASRTVEMEVLTRFPTPEEKEAWAKHYNA